MSEEYLDVLDEKGNITGQKKLRSEIHRDGDFHRIVHIWIINSKRQILMQKRSPQKETYPNIWAMSCEGHVQAGQTPIEGALRELEEELGLKLSKRDLIPFITYKRKAVLHNGEYLANHFFNSYLVNLDLDINNIVIQVEEVSEVKWMNFKEIKKCIEIKDPNFRPYEEEYPKLFDYLENQNI